VSPASARTCAPVLTVDQRAFFRENGYVVVPQLAPDGFLGEVQAILEALVDEKIATWRATEVIDEDYAEADFVSRYYLAWLAAGRPRHVTTTDEGCRFREAVAELRSEPWLLDLATSLLGSEQVTAIDSSFFRAKFPGDASTTVPWHQDAQCLDPVSGDDFVTAWIPLVDVAERNSCLEVSPTPVPGLVFTPTWSSQSNYVCMRRGDADALTDVRPVRMQRGDVLALSACVPHRSLDNVGTRMRWSIDLRYRPGAP
jgi:ectoine hydroxylase-related dioxygenase (phytanoyl-CoA dioxygenase family)